MSRTLIIGQVGDVKMANQLGVVQGQATFDPVAGYRFEMLNADVRFDVPVAKALKVYVGGVLKLNVDSAFAPSGADNLGNHTATQTLNMAGFSITNALNLTATGTVTAAQFVGGGAGLTGVVDATKMPLAGGTFSGAVSHGGNSITNVLNLTATGTLTGNHVASATGAFTGTLTCSNAGIGFEQTAGTHRLSGGTIYNQIGTGYFQKTSTGAFVVETGGVNAVQFSSGSIFDIQNSYPSGFVCRPVFAFTNNGQFQGQAYHQGLIHTDTEIRLNNFAGARVNQLNAASTNVFKGPIQADALVTASAGATFSGGTVTVAAPATFICNPLATFNNGATVSSAAMLTVHSAINLTNPAAAGACAGVFTFGALSTLALTAGATLTNNATGTHTAANTFTGTSTVNFNGAPLAFTASTEARVDGGIRFGAGGSLLQNYDEVSYSPTIVGGTAAGVGTYTRQLGKYMRVGRGMMVEFDLAWSNHTGTGALLISLPAGVVAMGAGNLYRGFGAMSNYTLRLGDHNEHLTVVGVAGTGNAVLLTTNTANSLTSPATVSIDPDNDVNCAISGTLWIPVAGW